MVGRRRLGRNGPELSVIAYGAMRLPATVEGRPAADHLCRLHDHGIDTHHSSHEYDAHPVYLDALAAARRTGRRFRHIVKLSEPSFDHHRFDGDRLTVLLDERLRELDVEQVDSLQWLFRTPDPQDDEARLATLADQGDEIRAWIEARTAEGKVADVSIFPYSPAFAAAAVDAGLSRTLCTYLNLVEQEYLPLLDRVDAFIAIRPLAGGRLAGGEGPSAIEAIAYTLAQPKVTTSVVSVNSTPHLHAALEAAGVPTPTGDGS